MRAPILGAALLPADALQLLCHLLPSQLAVGETPGPPTSLFGVSRLPMLAPTLGAAPLPAGVASHQSGAPDGPVDNATAYRRCYKILVGGDDQDQEKAIVYDKIYSSFTSPLDNVTLYYYHNTTLRYQDGK
jgi:hypothetical protein